MSQRRPWQLSTVHIIIIAGASASMKWFHILASYRFVTSLVMENRESMFSSRIVHIYGVTILLIVRIKYPLLFPRASVEYFPGTVFAPRIIS